MQDIYRCSNCGNQIRLPNDPCSACGFKGRKDSVKISTERVLVLLRDWGDEPHELKQSLQRTHGFHESIFAGDELPKVLYDGTDRLLATEIKSCVLRHGGDAELLEDDAVVGRNNAPRPATKKSSIGRFLTVIFFLAMMIVSYLSQHREEWRNLFQAIGKRAGQGSAETSVFADVDVIVSSSDIEVGAFVKLSNLDVIRIPRDQVPNACFCPKDVDLIIGMRATVPIDRGVILQQNMVKAPE